jgi:Protein of unknown function (DUF1501)
VIRFINGPGCSNFGAAIRRREWLRIGGLAGLGCIANPAGAGASIGATTQSRPAGFGRAKSVILVYANGGQSQLETWDPKPDAPAEIRGEFHAIRSAVPGTFIGEHLPRLARMADSYAIIRSMSHDDLDHGSATYLAMTGRYHPQKSANPPPRPSDFPTLGAVLSRVRPASGSPYTAVHVNGPALVPELPGPGQDGGFLGREHDPLLVGDVTRDDAALPSLSPPPELPPLRLEARRTLLQSIDSYRTKLAGDAALRDLDGLYRQAYDLLASPRCRAAFDLSAEPAQVRERYGLHRAGQACLLARRLVEAEVPLITVVWNHSARGQDTRPDDDDACGWDTHNDIFVVMRDHLLPRFDRSFSALLEDLGERGLLDQTLVVCMGEFGRAPRVALEAKFAGASPGRKHWANVYSIVLAGAGVARGAVLGASDRIAAYPQSDRVGPWDVSATIFSALGIEPRSVFKDVLGQPFPASIGEPIAALYGG